MSTRGRRLRSALLAPLLVFTAPAYATTQCPPEFGPKDPLVNALGWGVIAVGVVVVGLLFVSLIRRTRGMRKLSRSALLGVGFAGMLLVWVVGLVVALRYFLLQC